MQSVEAIAHGNSPCKPVQTSSEICFSTKSSNSGLIKGLGCAWGSVVNSGRSSSGASLISGVSISTLGAARIGLQGNKHSNSIISLPLSFNPFNKARIRGRNFSDRI